MKKILLALLLALPVLTFSQDVVIPYTSFENGSLPDGWAISQTNVNATWHISNVNPIHGSYSARILGDYSPSPQNQLERMILPEVDLSQANEATLTFSIKLADNDNSGLIVHVSQNNGQTWSNAWNYTQLTFSEDFEDYTVYPVTVDLSGWAGNNIKVAFTYGGYMGSAVYVDNIKMTSSRYCTPDFNHLLPITLVNFAGINNSTVADAFTPNYENFTYLEGNVIKGSAYSMTVKGQTIGTTTDYYKAYIDFNHNGHLDSSGEVFPIGTITTSTGFDSDQASVNITIPDGALTGPTRLRIIKSIQSMPLDPCDEDYNYGQTEDYTINILNAGGGTPGNYCIPQVTSVNAITSVNFAGIDKQSGAVNPQPDVEYFTETTGHVNPGNSYPIALKGNTGGNNTFYFSVFIDWNQNDILDDEGETYQIGSILNSTGTDSQIVNGSIAVPENALPGNTRMRIMSDNSFVLPDPCANYSFGQVEDYTLNVEVITLPEEYCEITMYNAEPISSVVFAGINNQSPTTIGAGQPQIQDFTNITGNVSAGTTYPISLKGNTDGAYSDYFTVFIDWNQNNILDDPSEVYEIGFINGSTGIDSQVLTGNIAVPATALNGSTRMRIVKDYEFSPTDPCGIYDYGQVEEYTLTVSNGPVAVEYCTAEITLTTEPITQVIFAGINNQTSPAVDGPDMENFISITGNVTAGTSYPVTLKGNTAGNYTDYFTVFIDLNKNGILSDAGEIFEIGPITNSTGTDTKQATGTILIPATASTGITRLRIVKDYELSPLNPCGAYDYGEIEDYSLNILPVPAGVVYCANSVASAQPITKVVFAGIDNATSAATNTPGSENFTAITGNVIKGNAYDMIIKGNTNGNFSNNFVVFIDWDKNGVLSDAGEIFPMGYIANSTGVDAKQTTGTITIPATASTGITRMRVLKKYGGNVLPVNPCENFGFGQVEDYSLNITAPPPVVYCTNTVFATEPITKVVFAGINNSTAADTGQPGSEDFTAITGNVVKGSTYTITLKGNTNGNFSNNLAVFIDWNKNGLLSDAGETFQIGYIANSTGTDTDEAIGSITVPSTAITGTTRMRVLKRYGGNTLPTNPCENFGFGQVEDYSIIITGTLGIETPATENFSYHYNSATDVLSLSSSDTISDILVFSIGGQLLMHKKALAADVEVNMEAFSDGIYIVNINCSGKSKKIKLIKN